MSKRTLIVIVLTSAIVVAIGGTALAKGPESATITGPGIDEPIEIELIETAHPDVVQKLMGQTGLWVATGGGSRIPAEPTWDLGPAYTLTWINSGPPGDPVEKRTIRQILYPLAERGPVIETPSQIGLEGWGPDVIGWFIAPDGLADTLTAMGVPISAPQSNNDVLPSNTAVAEASADSDPVPAPEAILEASASTNPDAAAPFEVEPADGVRYLAVAGFVLVIVLIWTARPRTTATEQ